MASSSKIQGDISKGYGVQNLLPDVQRLYAMLLSSPQFMQMLSQNMGAAGQFNTALQGNLASTGLGQSGIGALLGAAGQSAGSFGETALRGGLFGEALQTALQNQLARLSSYTSIKSAQASQPGPLAQIGGSILGAAGTALTGPLGFKLFGPQTTASPPGGTLGFGLYGR